MKMKNNRFFLDFHIELEMFPAYPPPPQVVSSSFVFKSFFYMVSTLVVTGLFAGLLVRLGGGCSDRLRTFT